MSQVLKDAINEIRVDAAALQEKVDALENIRDLSAGERQKIFELGNGLRGVRGFALGELAAAAGIDVFREF